MDFLELAKNRQSCRSYDPSRPVEAEKIDYIIDCLRQSPSACNSQPYSFTFVTESGAAKDAAEAVQPLGSNKFAADCVSFVIVTEEKANLSARVGALVRSQEFASMDIGLAAAHIVLAAETVGLSTCIMGMFNEKALKARFGIEKSKRIRLVISLGYKKEGDPIRTKKRKPLEEVIKKF